MSSDSPAQAILTRRIVWTTYAYIATFAYMQYALGNATPYIRADLGLSDFEVGLHGTALGLGAIVAGVAMHPVARAVGGRRALSLTALALAAGALLIASAPSLAISVLGALLVGTGGGALITQTNATLGGSGDSNAPLLLTRANAWAMASGMLAPAALAAAGQAGVWRVAILLPLAGLVVVSAARSGPSVAPAVHLPPGRRLGRAFWIGALFVTLAVAIEFSFVFWSSTLVEAQTGAPASMATLLVTLYLGGMFVGRAAIGAGMGSRAPRLLLTGSLGLVAVGAVITWLSPVEVVSGLGLLVAGFGTGGLYPVAITATLRLAAGAELFASGRLTLTTAVAILVAPSGLGFLSDAVGVMAAWPVVLVAIAAGVLVLYAMPAETFATGDDRPVALDAMTPP